MEVLRAVAEGSPMGPRRTVWVGISIWVEGMGMVGEMEGPPVVVVKWKEGGDDEEGENLGLHLAKT